MIFLAIADKSPMACSRWLLLALCLLPLHRAVCQLSPPEQAGGDQTWQQQQQQCSISLQVIPSKPDATVLCPTLARLATSMLLVSPGFLTPELVADQLATPFSGCATPTSTEDIALSVRATFSQVSQGWANLDRAFQDPQFADALAAGLDLQCPSNITLSRTCSSSFSDPQDSTSTMQVLAQCTAAAARPTTSPKPAASTPGTTTATIRLQLKPEDTASTVRPTAGTAQLDCDSLALLCNTQLSRPGFLLRPFTCAATSTSTDGSLQITVEATFMDDAPGNKAQQLQTFLTNKITPALKVAYGVDACHDQLSLRFTGRQPRQLQVLGSGTPACLAATTREPGALVNSTEPSLLAVKLRVLRQADAGMASVAGGVSDERIASLLFSNDQASLAVSAYTLLLTLEVPPWNGFKPGLCNQSQLLINSLASDLKVDAASVRTKCIASAAAARSDWNVQSMQPGSRRLAQAGPPAAKCDPAFTQIATVGVQLVLPATESVASLSARASAALSRAWSSVSPAAPCPPRITLTRVYHELQLSARPFKDAQQLSTTAQELAAARPTVLSLTVGTNGQYVSSVAQEDLKLLADAPGGGVLPGSTTTARDGGGAGGGSQPQDCPSKPVLWPLVFLGLGVGFLAGAAVMWLRMSQSRWTMPSSNARVWKSSKYDSSPAHHKASRDVELSGSKLQHQDITVRVMASCTTGESDGMAADTHGTPPLSVDMPSSSHDNPAPGTRSVSEGMGLPALGNARLPSEPEVLVIMTPAHTDPSLRSPDEASTAEQHRDILQDNPSRVSCSSPGAVTRELEPDACSHSLRPSPFTSLSAEGFERAGLVPEGSTFPAAPFAQEAPVGHHVAHGSQVQEPRVSSELASRTASRVLTKSQECVLHSDGDEDGISWLPPPPAPSVQANRSPTASSHGSLKSLSPLGSAGQPLHMAPASAVDAGQQGARLREAGSGSVSLGTVSSEPKAVSPTLTPVNSDMSLDSAIIATNKSMHFNGQGDESAEVKPEVSVQLESGEVLPSSPLKPTETAPKTPDGAERSAGGSKVLGIGRMQVPSLIGMSRYVVNRQASASRLSLSSRPTLVAPGAPCSPTVPSIPHTPHQEQEQGGAIKPSSSGRSMLRSPTGNTATYLGMQPTSSPIIQGGSSSGNNTVTVPLSAPTLLAGHSVKEQLTGASSLTAGTLTTPPSTDGSDVQYHAQIAPLPVLMSSLPPPVRSIIEADAHLLASGDVTPTSTGSPRSVGVGGSRFRSGKVQPFQRASSGSFVRVPVMSPLRLEHASHEAAGPPGLGTRASWAPAHAQQQETGGGAGHAVASQGGGAVGEVKWDVSRLAAPAAAAVCADGEQLAVAQSSALPAQQRTSQVHNQSRLPQAPAGDQLASTSAAQLPCSKPVYGSARTGIPGATAGMQGLNETRALQFRSARWKGLSSDSKVQVNPAFDFRLDGA